MADDSAVKIERLNLEIRARVFSRNVSSAASNRDAPVLGNQNLAVGALTSSCH